MEEGIAQFIPVYDWINKGLRYDRIARGRIEDAVIVCVQQSFSLDDYPELIAAGSDKITDSAEYFRINIFDVQDVRYVLIGFQPRAPLGIQTLLYVFSVLRAYPV